MRADVVDKPGERPGGERLCLRHKSGRRVAADDFHGGGRADGGDLRPDLPEQKFDAVDVAAAIHGTGEHYGAGLGARRRERIEIEVHTGVDARYVGQVVARGKRYGIAFGDRDHAAETAEGCLLEIM